MQTAFAPKFARAFARKGLALAALAPAFLATAAFAGEADIKLPDVKGAQFAYGLIFPAGKYWRFSLEGNTTITNYYGGQNAKGSMYAVSSQLSF